MKKLVALMLSLAMVIGLCAGAFGEAGNVDPYTGIAYAQDTEYTYLYGSEITSWNYLATSVTQNQKPLANFIDTLIEYDNLGNIVPFRPDNLTAAGFPGFPVRFILHRGLKIVKKFIKFRAVHGLSRRAARGQQEEKQKQRGNRCPTECFSVFHLFPPFLL